MAEISLSKALKLYSIFGGSVFKEVSVFSVRFLNEIVMLTPEINKKLGTSAYRYIYAASANH